VGRRKRVEDDDLLAVARKVFAEGGVGASTREIARRAGISEAVIYQRHRTKTHLFFAAMVPPALDVEKLLAAPPNDTNGLQQLEEIALRLMEYFRKVVRIMTLVVTHPDFDFRKFAHQHAESSLRRIQHGLVEYLESQRNRRAIATENVPSAALTLMAALHSFALFERLGVHGGKFDEAVVRAVVRSLWNGLRKRRSERRLPAH
jgi:AcrR family transcriptional regulator